METQELWEFKTAFPEQIDEADYIVIAADVAIDEASCSGNKSFMSHL